MSSLKLRSLGLGVGLGLLPLVCAAVAGCTTVSQPASHSTGTTAQDSGAITASSSPTKSAAKSTEPRDTELTQLAQGKSLPVTDYQDIRNLDLAKQFASCPTDTVLLRYAESPNFKVQICSKEYDLSLPGYYMGQAKDGSGSLTFKLTDRAAAEQGVYVNGDYRYVIYTDGLHRDGFRPQLQIFGPGTKLLTQEQLLSLYEKDFRPLSDGTPANRVDVTTMVPKIRRTTLPILLPQPFQVGYDGQVYLSADADANRYSVSLAAVPDCGGANACSIGFIGAERVTPHEALPFETIVTLTKGIKGSFKPLTCGASCSPPEIAWIQNGVMYSIQLKGIGSGTDDASVMAELIKIANSAIAAGPR